MSKMKDRLKKTQDKKYKEKDSGGNFGLQWFKKPEDLEMFKAQKGKNLVDILPYNVTTKNDPDAEKGDINYVLTMVVHKNVGPMQDDIVCLKQNYGKACPICEEREKLKENDEDEDLIKSLWPKKRCLYNIIDLKEKDGDQEKLFEVSHFKFEKELLEEAEESDDETIIFADPEEGMSISFRGAKAKFSGRDFIDIKNVSLEEREEGYEDDIIDETLSLDSLVNILTYSEIEKRFFGMEDEEDDESEEIDGNPFDEEDDFPEEDEEEKPAPKKKASNKKTTRKKVVEEEEEELDEDSEDEEEKPAPKKKASNKKPAKSKCPHGYTFGDDCDEYEECDDCDMWDECSDA